MGILILLCSGAVLGWLVSLITGAEDMRAAWLRVALGAGSTVLSGVLVSDVPLDESLGARALLVSIGTGLAVLALVSVMQQSARR